MTNLDRDHLSKIKTFPSLVKYLKDELDWPIESVDFDELTFDYEPEELGIDSKTAAKISEIKQLRPIVTNQPWGIFFVKFEPKQLPVVALRRILSQLVIKKRASGKKAEQATWNLHDLLFVSNYGEGDQRQITFAHFSQTPERTDLPTLKVLGWDDSDTALHIDHVHQELKDKLKWPTDEDDLPGWRETWSSAFTLKYREVITTSKELAVRLAELAKSIRKRANRILAIETEKGMLRNLHKAFKEALIHDLNEDDFADMYAQTIAYGLLTARVSRPMGINADDVANMVPITNPFLKEMLETFLTVGGRKGKLDFDELGIQEVVELLNSPDTHMDDILRDFGNRTRQEDPVIHFYEYFLTEYDKDKKVKRGVFYTPQPIVSFIVRSVHEILQQEFGLEDGLADTTTWGEMVKRHKDLVIPKGVPANQTFVQILDPATGTGTFLVEVIDIIYKMMTEKWKREKRLELEFNNLWNEYVPKHLLPRLHGYELLMAPYAIAHLKIGLKLFETGYRFRSDERARIFLTNALEPASSLADVKAAGLFEALGHEAQAVNEVKLKQRFTAVIGNPPYSKSSANRSHETERLVEKYKALVSDERNVQPLSDDYVKFIALSEKLLQSSDIGLLGMITNRGYIPGIIHRGMRACIVDSFSSVSILDCHGDTNIGETPPRGEANENVFDIQQGVAICCLVRGPNLLQKHAAHGDLWGTRTEKFSFLTQRTMAAATRKLPIAPNPPRYSFTPICSMLRREYESQLKMTQIFGTGNVKADQGQRYGNGIKSNRDALLIGFTYSEVVDRMNLLADTNYSDKEINEMLALTDGPYWNTAREREKIRAVKPNKMLRPILYRPFDCRWIWYQKNLIQIGRGGASPNLMYQMLVGPNIALLTSRNPQEDSFSSVFVTTLLSEMKTAEATRASYCFPLFIHPTQDLIVSETVMNFSPDFAKGLAKALQLSWSSQANGNLKTAGNVGPRDAFNFIYAQLHSVMYRKRYSNFLCEDFPRIFITQNIDLFRTLSEIGSELIDLHLLESPRLNNFITTLVGSGDFQVKKVFYCNETVWIDKENTNGFQDVSEDVWEFRIGGYQVCKKWLKDRQAKGGKNPRPGRVLTKEDIDHYQKIIVAISETIRIMKEIDEVIDQHGGWPGAFVTNTK